MTTRLRVDAVRVQVINTASADELKVAAGNNTMISKDEQKVLASDL